MSQKLTLVRLQNCVCKVARELIYHNSWRIFEAVYSSILKIFIITRVTSTMSKMLQNFDTRLFCWMSALYKIYTFQNLLVDILDFFPKKWRSTFCHIMGKFNLSNHCHDKNCTPCKYETLWKSITVNVISLYFQSTAQST